MKYHGHIKLRNDILASTQVVYIGKVQRLLTLFLTRLYLNRSLLTVSRALVWLLLFTATLPPTIS